MHPITAEYYRHKEDHTVVIRILKYDRGTITVQLDDPEATVFYLTRAELDYNFEPHLKSPSTRQ